MNFFSIVVKQFEKNEVTIFKKIVPRPEKNTLHIGSWPSGTRRSFSVLHRLLPKKKTRGKANRLLKTRKKSKQLKLTIKKLNFYESAKRKVLSRVYGTPSKARLKSGTKQQVKKRLKTSRSAFRRKKVLPIAKLKVKNKNYFRKGQSWALLRTIGKKKKLAKKISLWRAIGSAFAKTKPVSWWRTFRPLSKTKTGLKKNKEKKKRMSFWIYGPRANIWPAKVMRSIIKKRQRKGRKVVYRPILYHKRRLSTLVMKKRRRIRPWKYRLFKWKIFEYQRFNLSFRNHLGLWASMALFPHKLRRRRHQPYRYRKARDTKKNKWFRLLHKGKKPGFPVDRSWRLRNQQQYQKLYSFFYGITNSKERKKKARFFLRIRSSGTAKRNVFFSWVERRLDVALCRIRLAPTIKIARSLIARGFIWVNKKQVLNSNRRINTWDVVEINRKNLAFLRYWYLRNRFHRYVFKKKNIRYGYIHQQKQALTFGFLMKVPFEFDLPKKDLTTVSEVERLFLIK